MEGLLLPLPVLPSAARAFSFPGTEASSFSEPESSVLDSWTCDLQISPWWGKPTWRRRVMAGVQLNFPARPGGYPLIRGPLRAHPSLEPFRSDTLHPDLPGLQVVPPSDGPVQVAAPPGQVVSVPLEAVGNPGHSDPQIPDGPPQWTA